jgi:predicted AAA+ superfamily ATPase
MLETSVILEIARTWSYWEAPVPPSLPRRIELPETLSTRLVLVVQGVRRSGKSTLLGQMIDRYRLDPRLCAFLNFEDPRLAGHLDYRTMEALASAFAEVHPAAARRVLFFDEVQWVDGWERWLRSRLERPGAECFVVSGSNAHLLSGELGSTLTGRHLTVELFPFDLPEFKALVPEGTLEDFLHQGGFPEPLSLPDGDRLRRQYLSDILERDVRERVGARSSLALRRIVQMLFESAGSEVSLRRIAAAAGIAIETVAGYLEACENAYLLFACPYFAFSERRRSQRNRKYYPVDTGLRRIALTPGGMDRGKSLECAVFIALRRRARDVCYWRGKGEVDFVVASGQRITPVQVTWDEPLERHQRALDDFFETFPQAGEPVFVTADDFEQSIARIE